MTFNLGKLHLGERVSLKPNVPETRFDDMCAALPRTTGPQAKPKVTPGNPAACWHKPCRIIRVFQDGGFLLENGDGYVRQANGDILMKRYD
jgi:hypothetical protein